MKKTAFVLAILLCAVAVFAIGPVTEIATDMETLFSELGKDIMPGLQTASVLNHELGAAELGRFPHMYFSVSGGITTPGNVLTFLDDEDIFVNPQLFEQVTDQLNDARDNVPDFDPFLPADFGPFPSVRGTFGLGLFGGWEANVQFASIPQSIMDSVVSDEPITAELTTIGVRLRRVLVSRERGLLPAVSAGVGYTYSNLDFGYDLGEIEPLTVDENTKTYLKLNGEAKFFNRVHSFGTDVRASTRFLGIFYPFVAASAYYQSSSYEAGINNFSGTLEIDGTAQNPIEPAVQPFSEQELKDVNVVVSTGVDIKLLILNLFVHGNYALSTRAPGAVVGVRLQF